MRIFPHELLPPTVILNEALDVLVEDPLLDDGLLRGTPSAAGVDAGAIEGFLAASEAAGLELHGLMLHRRGRVVAEGWRWPYRPERPRMMHSFAKSVTAAAIGLAIQDGLFGLQDNVVSFFPDRLPRVVDDKLAAMTVEHLLTMRTGHAAEVGGPAWRAISSSWIDEFFRIPVVHAPGERYLYTSAASYMLAAILFRTTGETLHDYLRPRLFEPLGIYGETWSLGTDGFNPGGNGLSCRAADALKIGLVHADMGMWRGRRLLPEGWIAEATRLHSGDRYGYHWVVWPEGAYAAIGQFVQMVAVFPKAAATLLLAGAVSGSERLRPILFAHLPRAFHDQPLDGEGADAALGARLAQWGERPALRSASPWPAELDRRYRMEPNSLGVAEVAVAISADSCRFSLVDAGGRYTVAAGRDGWIEGRTDMPGRELHHGYALRDAVVVAGARWRDERTLELVWIFAETAFRDTVTCRFDGERLTLDRSVNINSAALHWPTLTGSAAVAVS